MALGGVGEAMLFGAALGAGTTAITNPDAKLKDYLKGAALGAGTGYIGGGGISNLLAGNPLANIASSSASTLGQQAAALTQAGQPIAGSGGISNLLPGASGASTPSVATNILGDPLAVTKFMETGGMGPSGLEAISPGAPVSSLPAGSSATPVTDFMKAGVPQAPVTPGITAPQTFSKTPVSLFDDPLQYAKDRKILAGSSIVAGALGGQRKSKIPERKRIEGLPIWQYGYADGGIASVAPPGYDMMVGEPRMYAEGGVSDLGTYSDGGRMLKGAGDGMSDSIPGVIGGKRPARLADGEFVVPADVVSHLGNGSTDAGAKQLYKMMDKVRAARTGTRKQGRQINPRRFMPA